MIRKMTCLSCPQGCQLEVTVENGHVINLTGNKCEKGPLYAEQEIENPLRAFSSTVLAEGLELKMVPVRTSGPIPKGRVLDAMTEIKKIRLNKPFKTGEAIAKDFLGLGVDLIATRQVSSSRGRGAF